MVEGLTTNLILSAVWAGESPMEASNGSAFLPLLAVLDLLGLKISWFSIHVGETDMATKLGLPQLALDLVSMCPRTARMAGLINSGYNFCVEILLVV